MICFNRYSLPTENKKALKILEFQRALLIIIYFGCVQDSNPYLCVTGMYSNQLN